MAISPKYISYLRKFKNTSSLKTLLNPEVENVICLRHDVDHDLDIALDMAYEEHKRGFRSTYFLLHNHCYCVDPLFLEKVLQIQDYGHEIGLHLNVIAGWINKEFIDPDQHLKDWLNSLRENNIEITGSATHGDPLCYERGFLNSWFFMQAKESISADRSLSAEGVPDPSGKKAISPDLAKQEKLIASARELSLFSRDMSEFGLEYEAVNLDANYWSDTGKDWHRTGDPLDHDLSQGRHQVLMHPIHWLGEPRKIFFLSSARTGSKWLAAALDKITSADVKHEFTLNNRYRLGKEVQEKLATIDYVALTKKQSYAQNLINYSLNKMDKGIKDQIEVNVYLEEFKQQIKDIDPKVELFGVVRDGKKVVASLLSRNWYSSTDSVRYPRNEYFSNFGFNQIEKAMAYWGDTYSDIIGAGIKTFRIEDIGSSKQGLIEFLKALSLPAHPRLIEQLDFEPVDSTKINAMYNSSNWSNAQKESFIRLAGRAMIFFDYDTESTNNDSDSETSVLAAGNIQKTVIFSQNLIEYNEIAFSNVSIFEISERGLSITLDNSSQAGWVVFSENSNTLWSKLCDSYRLIESQESFQIDGSIKFEVSDDLLCRVFLLGYDLDGDLKNKKMTTILAPGWRGIFSEKIEKGTVYPHIGMHLAWRDQESKQIGQLSLESFRLTTSRVSSSYWFLES